MSVGDDGPGVGQVDPYGWPGLPAPGPQPGPDYQQAYDPVTGRPLPPGPPGYSAVDPYAAPAGYAPPAYRPAYQPGYPPGYPPAGYPPVGYPPAGYAPGYPFVPMYPMVAMRPPKPGGAVAAAVLAFVQAGFVLIGSVFMFTGASFTTDGQGNRYSSEFTVIGFVLLIVGGLLIAGGTTMLGRRSTLLAVGGLLSIAMSVYFVVRLTDFAFGVAVWVPIVYAVLPVIAIALSMGSDVRTWIRTPAERR